MGHESRSQVSIPKSDVGEFRFYENLSHYSLSFAKKSSAQL
mgnify:CR=1 FL=1